MADFKGVNVAAITPRGKDGDLDLGSAFELIDFLSKAGIAGLALFTATGEYPALAADERSRLAYLASKRSRAPLFIGVGSATMEHSLGLAREARDSGAAALLLPPPYFFPYQQDDIREFYVQFANQLGRGVPLFLSHYPSSTAELSPETVRCLFETGLFAGIEDGTADAERAAALRSEALSRGLTYLAANDQLFQDARSAGASGGISPAACAVPELVVALDQAIAAEDRGAIERLGTILREFAAWSDRFPPPVVVKVATGLRGLKTGPLLAPLPLAKERQLEAFREWFLGWLPAVKKLSANV